MWKKCKIVRLTTEDVTNVAFVNWGSHGVPHWDFSYNHRGFTADEIYYHLYILSDDEIKEGDWCYIEYDFAQNSGYSIFQATNIADDEYFDDKPSRSRKIIASTDPSLNLPRPSNEFLKAYCREGGIDEVMIEYFNEDEDWDDTIGAIPKPSTIKVAPDNTVTIRKVKDSWSREEVINLCLKAWTECAYEGTYGIEMKDSSDFEDWIKENL